LNLFGLLDQAAERFGDRGAVFCGERQLHTWSQLRERALRIASTLGAPGTRIAIASENRPEIVELMFATWAAECVVVPINYKLHPREMVQIIDDAGVSRVFASPKIGAEPPTFPSKRLTRRRTRHARPARRRIGRAPLIRRTWRGSSTPAEPPAARRGRCSRTAT
jgi:acyl-CoA synthetase (AMP-forming)/AMP-acid ligase II